MGTLVASDMVRAEFYRSVFRSQGGEGHRDPGLGGALRVLHGRDARGPTACELPRLALVRRA